MRAGKVLVRFTDGVTKWVSPQGAKAAIDAGDGVFVTDRSAGGGANWGQPTIPGYSELPTGDVARAALTDMIPQMIPGGWAARTAAAAGIPAALRTIENVSARRPPMQGVGRAAAIGGGSQLVGEGGAGLVGLLGNGLLRASIPSTGRAADLAVAEMAAEKLPVGLGGKRAAAANFARATAARDAANAAATGTVSRVPLQNEMATMAKEAQGRSDLSSQMSALVQRYQDFLKSWRMGQKSPAEAQVFLSSLDEEAKPLWEAAGNKNKYVPPADRVVAQQAKRLSGVLRQQMQQIVNGHEVLSAKLARSIAAKDAIGAAEIRPSLLRIGARSGVGAAVGGTVGGLSGKDHVRDSGKGAALGAVLANSPEAMSRLGITALDPYMQMLLRAAGNQAAGAFMPQQPDSTR